MRIYADMCSHFAKTYPGDLSKIVEGWEPNDVLPWIKQLDNAIAAGIFEKMIPQLARIYLDRLGPKLAAKIIDEMKPDISALLCRPFPEKKRQEIFAELSQNRAKQILRMLEYPEGTAGSLMNPEFLSFTEENTVEDVNKWYADANHYRPFSIYITNREIELLGVLDIRQLALSDPKMALGDIMNKSVTTLNANTDREGIIGHPGWNEHHIIPVIDASNRLIGVIRYELVRQLEAEKRAPKNNTWAIQLGTALGEVYWLGAAGFVEGLATTIKRSMTEEPAPQESIPPNNGKKS